MNGIGAQRERGGGEEGGGGGLASRAPAHPLKTKPLRFAWKQPGKKTHTHTREGMI